MYTWNGTPHPPPPQSTTCLLDLYLILDILQMNELIPAISLFLFSFFFYRRFGLVTFPDCISSDPPLLKSSSKLLTKNGHREYRLLENEEYKDDKWSKNYLTCYPEIAGAIKLAFSAEWRWGFNYLRVPLAWCSPSTLLTWACRCALLPCTPHRRERNNTAFKFWIMVKVALSEVSRSMEVRWFVCPTRGTCSSCALLTGDLNRTTLWIWNFVQDISSVAFQVLYHCEWYIKFYLRRDWLSPIAQILSVLSDC